MLIRVAKIALSAATFAIDRPYTYRIPQALTDLVPGERDIVTFGAGKSRKEGNGLADKEEP